MDTELLTSSLMKPVAGEDKKTRIEWIYAALSETMRTSSPDPAMAGVIVEFLDETLPELGADPGDTANLVKLAIAAATNCGGERRALAAAARLLDAAGEKEALEIGSLIFGWERHTREKINTNWEEKILEGNAPVLLLAWRALSKSATETCFGSGDKYVVKLKGPYLEVLAATMQVVGAIPDGARGCFKLATGMTANIEDALKLTGEMASPLKVPSAKEAYAHWPKQFPTPWEMLDSRMGEIARLRSTSLSPEEQYQLTQLEARASLASSLEALRMWLETPPYNGCELLPRKTAGPLAVKWTSQSLALEEPSSVEGRWALGRERAAGGVEAARLAKALRGRGAAFPELEAAGAKLMRAAAVAEVVKKRRPGAAFKH